MAASSSWLRSACALSCALAYLSSSSTVNAHGYVSVPKAQYKLPANYTNFDFLLEAKDAGVALWVDKKWNSTPEKNTQQFAELFRNQTTYKTLKDFADTFVKDCANTRLDVPAVDVSALKELKFQNDEKQMGIVDTHHGPCEIWIDKTRMFQTDDCRDYTAAYPAVFPVNYSVCKGECTITFYLVAVHEPKWQIYKQCVPISNPLGVGPPGQLATSASGSGSSYRSANKSSGSVASDADVVKVPAPSPTAKTVASAATTTTSAVPFVVCTVTAVLVAVLAV
ncbi:hypothetical protein Gpo141_00011183 [Globisporangium polare]